MANPLRTALIVLALAALPGLAVIGAVWAFFGRERRTGYDREYEQEPPTDTEPALVPVLLKQGGEPGSYEWTATLFDLIRRGLYQAKPVTTERKIWGGLRTQTVSDLELSPGEDQSLRSWEQDVTRVVDPILVDGPERLSHFRDRIEDERTAMAPRFTSFKTEVTDETKDLGWFRSIGALPLALAGVLFIGVGILLIYFAADGWRSVYPRYSDVLLVIGGLALFANAVLVFLTLVLFRRVWRRRSPEAQEDAERWDAFRSYLTDFPRLDEAPPATLELWERYLVYGIAFGIAERVLQGAHIHMPEALATGERDLLDLAGRRPRVWPERARDRRPRVRLRERARPAELGLGWRRWRLLRRGRRGRRRRRRRVRLGAPRKLVERDRAGSRDIQRLGVSGQRDRCLVTIGYEVIG